MSARARESGFSGICPPPPFLLAKFKGLGENSECGVAPPLLERFVVAAQTPEK